MNTNSFLTLPSFYIYLGSLYLKKMKVSNHRAWNWSQRVETNLTVNKSAHCFWGDIEKYSFPLSSERLELTVPVQLFGRLYFFYHGGEQKSLQSSFSTFTCKPRLKMPLMHVLTLSSERFSFLQHDTLAANPGLEFVVLAMYLILFQKSSRWFRSWPWLPSINCFHPQFFLSSQTGKSHLT